MVKYKRSPGYVRKSRSRRRCSRGRKLSGGCKRKPGPKKGSSRRRCMRKSRSRRRCVRKSLSGRRCVRKSRSRRCCSRGRKLSGGCKRKPGPKKGSRKKSKSKSKNNCNSTNNMLQIVLDKLNKLEKNIIGVDGNKHCVSESMLSKELTSLKKDSNESHQKLIDMIDTLNNIKKSAKTVSDSPIGVVDTNCLQLTRDINKLQQQFTEFGKKIDNIKQIPVSRQSPQQSPQQSPEHESDPEYIKILKERKKKNVPDSMIYNSIAKPMINKQLVTNMLGNVIFHGESLSDEDVDRVRQWVIQNLADTELTLTDVDRKDIANRNRSRQITIKLEEEILSYLRQPQNSTYSTENRCRLLKHIYKIYPDIAKNVLPQTYDRIVDGNEIKVQLPEPPKDPRVFFKKIVNNLKTVWNASSTGGKRAWSSGERILGDENHDGYFGVKTCNNLV